VSPLSIVYSNRDVVVVDKPAGWLSVPSRQGASDPRPVVGLALQAQLGCRLWPVHRLDEEVAGLLVFARGAEAHRLLCAAFEDHRVDKTYHARCQGPAPSDAQPGAWVRWTSTLLRGKKRAYVHAAGKLSLTDVWLQGTDASGLQFFLRPRTGRGHQLRVELARRGCPILGDTLYGAAAITDQPGIALSAIALSFSGVNDARVLHLPATILRPNSPPLPERPGPFDAQSAQPSFPPG
jgi:tRNA pseudouridine32 synthase / 23S rRNA pseudouridine746 synthase